MIDLTQEEIRIHVKTYKELVNQLDYIYEATKILNLPNKTIIAFVHETKNIVQEECFVIKDAKLRRTYRHLLDQKQITRSGLPYTIIRPKLVECDTWNRPQINI